MNPVEDRIGGLLSQLASDISQRALALDPVLQQQLATLSGRRIEIQCSTPPLTWYLEISEQGLSVYPGTSPSPNAIVSGSALDLVSWLLPGAAQGQVAISGDETLLMELTTLLRSYRPDAAPALQPLLGSELANNLVGAAEMGLRGLSSVVNGISYSLQNQAVGRFVNEQQVDELADGIDRLRLRVDRLAAKIRHAEAANEEPPE